MTHRVIFPVSLLTSRYLVISYGHIVRVGAESRLGHPATPRVHKMRSRILSFGRNDQFHERANVLRRRVRVIPWRVLSRTVFSQGFGRPLPRT